ncbi:hypothetical protein DMENIID0001_046400 [Sergentomyia squamirostris]
MVKGFVFELIKVEASLRNWRIVGWSARKDCVQQFWDLHSIIVQSSRMEEAHFEQSHPKCCSSGDLLSCDGDITKLLQYYVAAPAAAAAEAAAAKQKGNNNHHLLSLMFFFLSFSFSEREKRNFNTPSQMVELNLMKPRLATRHWDIV